MRHIIISDATLTQSAEGFSLSFKEKIELAKLLDKLGVDVIEIEGIKNPRIDPLQIKSIASSVATSIIAAPVELNAESVERVWAAIKDAKKPRLQVVAPASSVQIEYLYHKKPDAMLDAVKNTVSLCAEKCSDVEIVISDATRSEQAFLTAMISTAISAGAKTVTLCDTAGTMLAGEFAEFIRRQYTEAPALSEVAVGVCCSNAISMADASAIAAVSEGISQIRAAAYPIDNVSLASIVRILNAKSDVLGASSSIGITQIGRITEQITWLCQSTKTGSSALVVGESDTDGIFLTSHDDIKAVSAAVAKLGYDLSDEDNVKVYNAFLEIAGKREKISLKELEVIVASSAMQVPSTYKLDTYVINSGNTISATAHIKLSKNGKTAEGVYIGDGSINAAFQAIEQITGCHYELDDFQLQAVTEGREAMGQTVVKLRAGGKVYSGRGISTDIVGAGIQAYLSALNKIIYEEEEQ